MFPVAPDPCLTGTVSSDVVLKLIVCSFLFIKLITAITGFGWPNYMCYGDDVGMANQPHSDVHVRSHCAETQSEHDCDWQSMGKKYFNFSISADAPVSPFYVDQRLIV